jgi:hypothetical protein
MNKLHIPCAKADPTYRKAFTVKKKIAAVGQTRRLPCDTRIYRYYSTKKCILSGD